jgi:hypothetical protein
VPFPDPRVTVPARSFCNSPPPAFVEPAAGVPPRPLPRPAAGDADLEDARKPLLPRPRGAAKGVARPPLVELPPRWPRVDGADIAARVVDQHRGRFMPSTRASGWDRRGLGELVHSGEQGQPRQNGKGA